MSPTAIGNYPSPPAIPAEITWSWLKRQEPLFDIPGATPEMLHEIFGPGRIWPPQNTPAKGRLSFATGEHEELLKSPEALQVALDNLEAESREPGRVVREVLNDEGQWVPAKQVA